MILFTNSYYWNVQFNTIQTQIQTQIQRQYKDLIGGRISKWKLLAQLINTSILKYKKYIHLKRSSPNQIINSNSSIFKQYLIETYLSYSKIVPVTHIYIQKTYPLTQYNLHLTLPNYIQTKNISHLLHFALFTAYLITTFSSKLCNIFMGNHLCECISTQKNPNLSTYKLSLPQPSASLIQYSNFSSVILHDGSKKSTITTNDFQPKKFLDTGCYGSVAVVRRRNIQDDKLLAMKIIEKVKLKNNILLTPSILERELLYKHSPFLVPISNIFQNNRKTFIIMDYVEPGDLLYYILKQKWLKESTIRQISCEILQGLKCLHRQGLIYQSLKPENVLIQEDGHIKLTDYWLSRIQPPNSRCQDYSGIIQYAAPEVLNNLGYNNKIDVWAFGVLLYQMRHGKTPFGHFDQQYLIRSAICQGLYIFNQDCSLEFQDLIRKCLCPNPAQRPSLEQIQKHPFFSTVDWEMVFQRRNSNPMKELISKFNTRSQKSSYQKPRRIFASSENEPAYIINQPKSI